MGADEAATYYLPDRYAWQVPEDPRTLLEISPDSHLKEKVIGAAGAALVTVSLLATDIQAVGAAERSPTTTTEQTSEDHPLQSTTSTIPPTTVPEKAPDKPSEAAVRKSQVTEEAPEPQEAPLPEDIVAARSKATETETNLQTTTTTKAAEQKQATQTIAIPTIEAPEQQTKRELLEIMNLDRDTVNQRLQAAVNEGRLRFEDGQEAGQGARADLLDPGKFHDNAARVLFAIVEYGHFSITLSAINDGHDGCPGGGSMHCSGDAFDIAHSTANDPRQQDIYEFLFTHADIFPIFELIHWPLPEGTHLISKGVINDDAYGDPNDYGVRGVRDPSTLNQHISHIHVGILGGFASPQAPAAPGPIIIQAPAPVPAVPEAGANPLLVITPAREATEESAAAPPTVTVVAARSVVKVIPAVEAPAPAPEPQMTVEQIHDANRAYLATISPRAPWALDLLDRLGAPETVDNVWALTAWGNGENTEAAFNPLATTQSMPNDRIFNTFGDHNQYHVKSYASYEDGLTATVTTLTNGYYPNIVAALMGGSNAMAVVDTPDIYTWGTGEVAKIRLEQLGPTPPPYTPPAAPAPQVAPVEPAKTEPEKKDVVAVRREAPPTTTQPKVEPTTTTAPPAPPPTTAAPPPPPIDGKHLTGADNEEKIYNYLVGKGLTPVQAAGVMGNLQAESGFDPAIVERGNGIGFGLAQWSFDRRTSLENTAAAQGIDPSDLGFQLDYLYQEVTQRPVDRTSGYPGGMSEWDGLEQQTSVDDAVLFFHNEFEVSNDNLQQLASRVNLGKEVLARFS